MYRIYHKALDMLRKLYYWGIDYAYAVFWQVRSILPHKKPTQANYLQDSHREPIILLPGIYETWYFMTPLAKVLYDNGYTAHIIPRLGYNTGTVEAMATVVEEYVRQQNISSYSIVAHSKGGLIAKYLLMSSKSKVRQAITINTPFGGSWYAGLFFPRAMRVFLASSPTMRMLTANTVANTHIVSIYGQFDPHIPSGSYLHKATNIQLDTYGHFRILRDPLVHEAILKFIAR